MLTYIYKQTCLTNVNENTLSWCRTESQSACRYSTKASSSIKEQVCFCVSSQHTHRPCSTCNAQTVREESSGEEREEETKNKRRQLTWHLRYDLTICAFWQDSMEPARLRITHTADSSMNNDTCTKHIPFLFPLSTCQQAQAFSWYMTVGHTTRVKGLLQDITPTIPEATTYKGMWK